MSEVVEDTRGKTRDLPISEKLRTILLSAADESGIQIVRVTSGGQCRKGTCSKRTGSVRHDDGNAADLQLINDGNALKFTDDDQVVVFEDFVEAAARSGATGFGAGIDYMGDDTIHVGFGSRAVWGSGGRSASAPAWIRRAAQAGWQRGGFSLPQNFDDNLDSTDEELEDDF